MNKTLCERYIRQVVLRQIMTKHDNSNYVQERVKIIYGSRDMEFPDKPSYFNDKKRKIDFVLVIDSHDTREDRVGMLQEYLKKLQEKGLQTEQEKGRVVEETLCIKIHAPLSTLDKYLEEQIIDLSCDNMNFKKDKPFSIFGLKWFQNDLLNIKPGDAIFERAPKTFSSGKPTDYTDAERILLVEKMLSELPFSEKDEDRGYKMLIKKDVIEAAYPLHDSSAKWNWDKPLTDRQILKRYWASIRCFYKQQPLYLIQKYYDSEVAFYFAWLGFYTTMLFPAALLSLICIIPAILIYIWQKDTIIQEVCESNQMMCSVCPIYETCDLQPLRHSCETIKVSYALDNPATVLYSTIMCFWGITFLIFWRRKQAMLKLRWNLNDINVDNSIRPEFIKSAPIWRISSVTGQKEYIIPNSKKVIGYLVTYLIYAAMFILYALGIMVVMIVRLNILYYGKKSRNKTYKEYLTLMEAFISAILTTCIISLFDCLKSTTAKCMTKWQNPRTKIGYHRRYITKIVILSLADVFSPIFYLAYFKGHFYEHPGDATQWTFFGMVKSDVCEITGCLVNLAAQILTLLFMKNIIRLLKEMLTPVIKVFFNKLVRSSDLDEAVQPVQWEKDFFLIQPQEGFLFGEYITMIVQYSFITFFIVALPIAPLLAFVNNVIELRLDAKKILTQYRRTVPKKVNGIEEWNTVVQVLTVLGAISNPLLLAFSSSLIPKTIYFLKNNWSLKGYINSTLSEFNLKDAKSIGQDSCLYYGKRYPPSHELKYQRTSDFWHELAVRTIFFVVLENLCLLVSMFLNHNIPVIPRKVEIKLLEDQRILRETKLQRSKSQASLLRLSIDGNKAGPSKTQKV